MSKTIIESPSDLYDLVGTTLGPSPSMEITQERINQFADATGDHQWIHIDAERAAKGSVWRHYRPRLPHDVAGR